MKSLKGSIIELRKKGKSINEIKEILNCSKGTISYHLNKEGLGGDFFKKNKGWKKLNDDDFLSTLDKGVIERAVFLRKEGSAYFEILNKVDISRDKLKRLCGIFKLTRVVNRNKYATISDSKKREFQDYYNKVNSIRKVAKEFNVNKNTVLKYVKTNGISVARNKEERKLDNVKYVTEFRKRRKKELVDYKGGKCQCCGYNKSMSALEFHHINPLEKSFTIGGRNYSLDLMKKEVDKCLLTCSNCHSEIHEEINENGFSSILNKILNKCDE